MSATILTWAGEKGGGGKSTNIIHISCCLKKRGKKVLVIDLDDNKSVRSWAAKAGDNGPAVVNMGENLKNDVNKIKNLFDYILIDCEGSLNQMMYDAINVSDAVIIPYQPSPLDVWGNASLTEIILAKQETTGKPKATLLMNAYDKRNRISEMTMNALEKHRLPLLKEKTTRLTDYVLTIIDGGNVTDLGKNNQAAAEIETLTDAILEFANG